MSKDPIEEQLRDLPWRKPSQGLKERIFASSSESETKIVRGRFLAGVPLAWAAAVMIGGVALTYLASQAPWASEDSPAVIVEADHVGGFFDLTSDSDDAWMGPLTLTISPSSDSES